MSEPSIYWLCSIISFGCQCLCIAPTYELAVQIGQVIEQMGKFYPEVKLAYAIRGNKGKNVLALMMRKIGYAPLHFRPLIYLFFALG